MNDNIINVSGLKKYYKNGVIKALNGVDLEVKKGEVIVVIGPSGCGKSTLLRSLNLLENPTEERLDSEAKFLVDFTKLMLRKYDMQ